MSIFDEALAKIGYKPKENITILPDKEYSHPIKLTLWEIPKKGDTEGMKDERGLLEAHDGS